MTLSNKQKIIVLQSSIETLDPSAVAHIHPQYVQHNLQLGDGLGPIQELHALLPSETTRARPLRAIEDGAYVAVHVEYDLWGPKAGFDVHRFEDGRSVEHWDNLQELPVAPNPSGRTMLDGDTEVTDLHATEANKTLVRRFIEEALVGANVLAFAEYFDGEHLIQHSPLFGDGVKAWQNQLEAGQASDSPSRHERVHLVLGEGNFVLVVSEGRLSGTHSAFFDLFRVASGKIAEHWDVIEAIPPREQWKNDNGKF